MYGKNPVRFGPSIERQSQYERVIPAVAEAASALSLTALKPSPGGSIRPFWEPPTVTSTPHSSWR